MRLSIKNEFWYKNVPFIFIQLFLFGLTLSLFPCTFQTADDGFIRQCAEGQFISDSGSPFLWYSSFYEGSILYVLYKLFPLIDWYSLFVLTPIFICAISIQKIFQKQSLITQILVSIAHFIVILLPFIIDAQFTSISLLAGIYGYTFLTFHTKSFNKNAIILLLFSVLIRPEPFLVLTLLFLLTYLTILYLTNNLSKIFLLPKLGLVFIIFLCLSDKFIQNEFDDLKRINDSRFEITDLNLIENQPSYLTVQNALMKVNWTENDLQLLQFWCYWDSYIYNPSALNKFVSILKATKKPRTLENIYTSINFNYHFQSFRYKITMISYLILLGLVILIRWKDILLVVPLLIISFLIIVLITYTKKYPDARFFNPFILASILPIVLYRVNIFYRDFKQKKSYIIRFITCAVLGIYCSLTFSFYKHLINENITKILSFNELISEFNQLPSNINYICPGMTFNDLQVFRQPPILQTKIFQNSIYQGNLSGNKALTNMLNSTRFLGLCNNASISILVKKGNEEIFFKMKQAIENHYNISTMIYKITETKNFLAYQLKY